MSSNFSFGLHNSRAPPVPLCVNRPWRHVVELERSSSRCRLSGLMECDSDPSGVQRPQDGEPYGHASSGPNGCMVPTPATGPYMSSLGQAVVGGSGAASMMPAGSYMSGLHQQVQGHGMAAGMQFTAPELKTERKLFLPFLEQLLDDEAIEGLHWIDRDKRIFRMPWKHMKRHDYIQEKDAALFKAWAINSGKYKENDPDPSRWKINFRSALNTMKHVFVEIMDENVDRDDCRIFRIAVPPSENAAANRRKRALVPMNMLAQRAMPPTPIKPCPVTAAMPTFADYNQQPPQSDHAAWPQATSSNVPGPPPQPYPMGRGPAGHWIGQGMGNMAAGWQQNITRDQHMEMLRAREAHVREAEKKMEVQESVEMAQAQYDLANVAEEGEVVVLEGLFKVIFNGAVNDVTLQISLHLGFPQQPPDVFVQAQTSEMEQKCDSLIQQLECNIHWASKTCSLLGFLDAIASEFEKHDLAHVCNITTPARLRQEHRSVKLRKPSDWKSSGEQEDGEDVRNEQASQSAESGGAATTRSGSSSDFHQIHVEKRQPSAFQKYRKSATQAEAGSPTSQRRTPLIPPLLEPSAFSLPPSRHSNILNDDDSSLPPGLIEFSGNRQAVLQAIRFPATSSPTDKHQHPSGQRLERSRSPFKRHRPSETSASQSPTGHNFDDVNVQCQYLEEQCSAKDQLILQLRKRNSSLLDYQTQGADMEKRMAEMQHVVHRQSYEIAELRQHLEVKQAQVDKLESQLSVSKYYLNSAQQKLHKAPYLSQVRRDDREVVDILVRRKPEPAAAESNIVDDSGSEAEVTSDSPQQIVAEQIGYESDKDDAAAPLDEEEFDQNDQPSELDCCEPATGQSAISRSNLTVYESKCVLWEGLSSSESSRESPSPLKLDIVDDEDESAETAAEQAEGPPLDDAYTGREDEPARASSPPLATPTTDSEENALDGGFSRSLPVSDDNPESAMDIE